MRQIELWVNVVQTLETARDGGSTARARALAWNRFLVPIAVLAMALAVIPVVNGNAAPANRAVSLDVSDDFAWIAQLREAQNPLAASVAVITAGPRLPGSAITAARASRHPVAASLQADAHSLMKALGLRHGGTVYGEDLVVAGRKMGVALGPKMDRSRVEWLLQVHRNRAAPAVRAAGVNPGSQVDPADITRAAHAMGLKVGTRVDPEDAERLMSAVRARWAASEQRRAAAASRPRAAVRSAGVTGRVLASVDGVQLVVPSVSPRFIGFHQASYGVARNMRPFRAKGVATMSSRGRGTGRQSAVDVSVPRGTPVLAPVSGRVVEVRHYRLYGRYRDVRIRIIPNANHRRLVTVLHVTGPNVRVGSRITAGRTVIAQQATAFPFRSQIDRYAGRAPHVHVEVRRR